MVDNGFDLSSRRCQRPVEGRELMGDNTMIVETTSMLETNPAPMLADRNVGHQGLKALFQRPWRCFYEGKAAPPIEHGSSNGLIDDAAHDGEPHAPGLDRTVAVTQDQLVDEDVGLALALQTLGPRRLFDQVELQRDSDGTGTERLR